MKNTLLLFLVLTLNISVFGQDKDTSMVVTQSHTRNYTLSEVIKTDSIQSLKESPLIRSLKNANLETVKEVFKLNKQNVDSTLAADSLNANFWRVYGYQAAFIVVESTKSPQMAIAVFLPVFLIILLITIFVASIKTFFIRPRLNDAEKPDNDPNAIIDDSTEEYPDDDSEDDDVSEEDEILEDEEVIDDDESSEDEDLDDK